MKKKIIISCLLIVPLISIILIVQFRHYHKETKEEIVKYVAENQAYCTKVQYEIKNTKGENLEEAKIVYSKDFGTIIYRKNGDKEIYRNETINIISQKDEYKLDEDFDVLYSLAFINKVLEEKIVAINEKQEEWGETEYLEIEVFIKSNNNHINKVKTYINKKDKTPIITKVFDKNGQETVEILYIDFQYLDNVDKKNFKVK